MGVRVVAKDLKLGSPCKDSKLRGCWQPQPVSHRTRFESHDSQNVNDDAALMTSRGPKFKEDSPPHHINTPTHRRKFNPPSGILENFGNI